MRELRRHFGLLVNQQPAKERYLALDVIRGVALLGVLLVNLDSDFRVSLWHHILEPQHDWVTVLLTRFLEFKAIDLFSLSFGISAALQASRAERPSLLLARRFLVLLGIGLIHSLLIWNGDILTLYAVCGFLLIPFLRLPKIGLAVAALAVLVASFYVPFNFPPRAVIEAEAVAATRIYATGTYAQIFLFRLDETARFIAPLLLATLPRVFGLMLLGAALLKAKFFQWPRHVFAITAAVGLAVGFTLNEDIPIALGYGSMIMLFPPRVFAAAGQMALTNYLMQSVVFSLVFYGYGFGLFGTLAPAPVAAFGIAFYALQIFVSRIWLRRLQFGPAEWVWRSLTYGVRLPL